MTEISNLIEEYIECPEENLMMSFEGDKWGVTDILRVCDRRIGKRRLEEIRDAAEDKRIIGIVEKRLR